MVKNRDVLVSLCVVALPVLMFGCTFPVIEIGAGGAHGTTSATSANGQTNTSSVTSSAGQTASATTDAGSSQAASSSTGTLQMCTACLQTSNCDCDGDHVERYDQAHGCTNVANDAAHRDCDDCSGIVFPGQTGFFPTARPNGSFDYDCDGSEEQKFKEGVCGMNKGNVDGCMTSYLETSAACGAPVSVYHCKVDGLLGILSACLLDTTEQLANNPCH